MQLITGAISIFDDSSRERTERKQEIKKDTQKLIILYVYSHYKCSTVK